MGGNNNNKYKVLSEIDEMNDKYVSEPSERSDAKSNLKKCISSEQSSKKTFQKANL